jgi:hypothetical protein
MSAVVIKINTLLDKTLISRVLIIYALCATAETEAHRGDFDRAVSTVEAVRRVIGEVRIITAEPYALSPGAARELREILDEVDAATTRVERTIPPSVATIDL